MKVTIIFFLVFTSSFTLFFSYGEDNYFVIYNDNYELIIIILIIAVAIFSFSNHYGFNWTLVSIDCTNIVSHL